MVQALAGDPFANQDEDLASRTGQVLIVGQNLVFVKKFFYMIVRNLILVHICNLLKHQDKGPT